MTAVAPHRKLAFLACVLALLGLMLVAGRPAPVRAGSASDQAAADRHQYSVKVAATYNYRFGRTNPFLPSNATTDTGEFLDPAQVPSADYCGHCHQASHAQWRESAHSNANRAPFYQKNVALLIDSKGVEYSRHCEGCHNPVALFAGALTESAPKIRPYDADGVTCAVCHSIKSVDKRGTGSYTLGVPAVLVDEDGKPITRKVSDAEVLAHLDRHSAAVMKPFYKTSEFCAACHKGALPATLNDYKWQRAFSAYDEWQNSSFAQQSPLPFYQKASVSTCQTCHMGREALSGMKTSADLGAKHGELASHRWLGANTVIPQIYGYDEQLKRIREILRHGALNVDLFALELGDPETPSNIIAPLGQAPFLLIAGETVTVDVVIQNKGIAHSLVPEQRDMFESWVAFTVSDAAGHVIAQSGELRPDGSLDPAAHSFTNRLINSKGELNAEHQVWTNRVVAYNNSIQSGRSQIVRYSFRMPAAAGPVTVTARVRYRRFNQHFIDFGMSPGYKQPIVDMSTASRTLRVGQNAPELTDSGGDPLQNPIWMRWNNYGIGLLDAQQYAASVQAFQRVASLRPEYADPFINMAVAQIAWQRFAAARPNLQHALALSPGNPRALYYRALIERNAGEAAEAIADLRQVAIAFPESRDAHRELGFSFFQLQQYAAARVEYEHLQRIDPDDLAAHYSLALIYRRLGLPDLARIQSATFADQKDDPAASAYALQYLEKHSEVASEGVPWHVHLLGIAPSRAPHPIIAPTSSSMSGGS